MDTTIRIQLYIFLTSIYAGLLIGLIYDLYRVLRYFFKPRRLVSGIEDLIFWLGIAIIYFYIMNKSNWGELRGYVFFGTFIGGIIYLKILSKILHPLMMKVIKAIILVIKWTINMIKVPFVKMKKLLKPRIRRVNRIKRVPKEAIKEIRRYRKIISQKK